MKVSRLKQDILQELVSEATNYDRIINLIQEKKGGKPNEVLDRIDSIASDVFSCLIIDLYRQCKFREVVYARFVLFYYLRNNGWAYGAIGERYGKDHSTVLYGVKEATKWIKEKDDIFYPKFKEFLSKLSDNKIYKLDQHESENN